MNYLSVNLFTLLVSNIYYPLVTGMLEIDESRLVFQVTRLSFLQYSVIKLSHCIKT